LFSKGEKSTSNTAQGNNVGPSGSATTRVGASAPNTFNPAKRSGLDFDTSVRELLNGLQEIEIRSNQVILHNGSLTVPSRPNPNGAFNLIDSRFNPATGDLNVDFVFTFNKGKGVGSELISRAVETAGSNNVKSIVGRLGADNKKIFDSGVAQGLSPLEAALKTPAAKIRQNLGFKNIEVTFDADGNPILRGSR
jgi:filamentous hemagglutinin